MKAAVLPKDRIKRAVRRAEIAALRAALENRMPAGFPKQMCIRDSIMGKASFSDLSDRYGRLQLYIKRDNVGDEVYKGYKKFDIGDIIGVEGEVFRTQKRCV